MVMFEGGERYLISFFSVLLDNIGRTNTLSDDDSSDIPSGLSDADSDLDECK